MAEQPTGDIEIPEIMHASAIDGFGGPETMTLHKVPGTSDSKGEEGRERRDPGRFRGRWNIGRPVREIASGTQPRR